MLFRLEHGDGNQKYIVIWGQVPLKVDPSKSKLVVVVFKKLPEKIEVEPRMSQTLSVITSVAYSKVQY